MNIPNVTLIHPNVSSEKLIKNSSLVVTISGTATLEAALFQKPSITFIDADYTKISSIERVKSVEELPKIIRKSLEKKITPKISNTLCGRDPDEIGYKRNMKLVPEKILKKY